MTTDGVACIHIKDGWPGVGRIQDAVDRARGRVRKSGSHAGSVLVVIHGLKKLILRLGMNAASETTQAV